MLPSRLFSVSLETSSHLVLEAPVPWQVEPSLLQGEAVCFPGRGGAGCAPTSPVPKGATWPREVLVCPQAVAVRGV